MKKIYLPILMIISILFFYKVFLFGLVPFPGELLVSEYSPWKSYSYLGYNPGSIPSKVQYFDTLRQIYSWKTLSIDLIKNAQFPLWNPYNFSGSPLFANFQSAILYPFNVLYLIFPQIFAWSILIILQPLLAGLFIYLFVREIGLSPKASVFSGIAYPFSLFMSVFLEYNTFGHVILWLPLILYLAERIIKKVNFLNLSLFVLSLLFSFFGGHLQLFGFVLIFSAAYIIIRLIQNPKKQRLSFLFAFLFVSFFGICSIQLIPTLELINQSARVSQNYKFLIENLLIQPQQLILLISPDFFGNPAAHNYLLTDSYPGNALYIGLIPLILSLFSVKVYQNKFVKFFLISSLVLLFFFIRTPITQIFYKLEIPFFSSGSPTNAIFLLSFCLSVLSGFGFDFWLKEKKIPNIIFLFTGLFGLIWFFIIIFHPSVVAKNFIYSSILFFVLLFIFSLGKIFDKRKNTLAILLILITVLDLFYFFQKFNPFVSKELVFPKTEILNSLSQKSGIDRFWGYGNANIQANFATQYKLFSPDGYDPLYPKIYGEFIQSSIDGKIKTDFNNLNRSDAVIAGGYGEKDFAENQYRLKIINLLGVKYILDRVDNGSTEKTFPITKFKLVYDKDGWKIFENLGAIPRIFLTSSYIVIKNKDEFEKYFFNNGFNPSEIILLEENLNKKFNKPKDSIVELVSYSPNKIMASTRSDQDQLLFLSDTFYPGWKAYIDGQETKIYRADYAFRSIIVPKGVHKVSFEYRPLSFEIGLKTSIISLMAFIVIAFLINKKRLVV